MGRALTIRDDLSAGELRACARRERGGRAAARMYATANAPEGMRRAEAARLAGMERQALRDAVVRYDAAGLAGLRGRPGGRPPRRLDEGEEAALIAVVLRGPDPERDGGARVDAGGAERLDAAALGQDPAPGRAVQAAAPAGLVLPEGATRAPRARRQGAGALPKKGWTRR